MVITPASAIWATEKNDSSEVSRRMLRRRMASSIEAQAPLRDSMVMTAPLRDSWSPAVGGVKGFSAEGTSTMGSRRSTSDTRS